MELLLLFLLTPTILVQGDGKNNDPNDEPFLPIYPVYPYSPKLIKRGTDRETVTQLSPELYAPKVDAKDSYSSSYSANYPRDPYYPNYNPYPKVSSSSGYSYYSSVPYSYPTTSYNPYATYSTPYTPSLASAAYTTIPYSSAYPNVYYQHPYYYPGHYSQSPYPPPPTPSPLPLPGTDYSSDPYTDQPTAEKNRDKSGDKRYRDSEVNQDPVGNQFVDGANYISENSKDLDSQPTTYKAGSSQNLLNQDLQIKNIPILVPKTTYRVISVAGQPVGPDYPLPATYVKAQQLEELFSQTWAKLMAQNLQQQSVQQSEQDTGKTVENQSDQSKDSQRLVSVPNVIAKAGLAYLANPSILGKLNVGQSVVQQPSTQLKNIKYTPLPAGVYNVVQKQEKDPAESGEYESYENPSSQGTQDYDSSSSQIDKQPALNYENDSARSVSYQNQNFVTVETPRRYNYQYSDYNPSQTITQQQSQQYKNNLDDANFGAKTKNG